MTRRRSHSACLNCGDKHVTWLCRERLPCNKPSFLPGLAEFSFRCGSRPLFSVEKMQRHCGAGRGLGGWWEPRPLPCAPPPPRLGPSVLEPLPPGRGLQRRGWCSPGSLISQDHETVTLPFGARHSVESYTRFLHVLVNESGIL